MAERIIIGLTFGYNEKWIGGSYYIMNLIHALKTLPDDQKPHLKVILDKEESAKHISAIKYPYMDLIPSERILPKILGSHTLNYFSQMIFGEHVVKIKAFKEKVDVLFKGEIGDYFRRVQKQVFWIPDFQEEYYPDFFSKVELRNRKNHNALIAKKAEHIIFSSDNALGDFEKFFPHSKTKKYVLNFAVQHPPLETIEVSKLLEKYDLKQDYFICSNQFWQHKNHLTVLKAWQQISMDCGENCQLVFTGKEFDHRNPNYTDALKNFVYENGLTKSVKFLGFVTRKDQLHLMNNAMAVIQPSLFEGWSTSVEDAKALNQIIIASDIAVHREQMNDLALFFNAESVSDLVQAMLKVKNKEINRPNFNYSGNIKKFGLEFMQIIKKLIPS